MEGQAEGLLAPEVQGGGVKMRRIHVEVCQARDLMPKDGGSADPFCIIDFDGKQKRSNTVSRTLNPTWNETFSFTMPHAPQAPRSAAEKHALLEITILSRTLTSLSLPTSSPQASSLRQTSSARASTSSSAQLLPSPSKKRKDNTFLGRVRIPINYYGESPGVSTAEGAELRWHLLEKRSFLSNVRGELGLKLWYEDLPPGVTEVDSEPTTPLGRTSPQASTSGDTPGVGGGPRLSEPGVQESSLGGSRPPRASTLDLVDAVQYLFVSVLQARHLLAKDATGTSDPYVKVTLGGHTGRSATIYKELNPEWNESFAFEAGGGFRDEFVELTVWDEDIGSSDDFLGLLRLPLADIPTRLPPNDPPVPPQWHKLGKRSSRSKVRGDILVAVWWGTQGDETYPRAWHSGTGGVANLRSRTYMAPKLWYLRVSVLEAENLLPVASGGGGCDPFVRLRLGPLQKAQTKAVAGTVTPVWQEDVFFVVPEPFEEKLQLEVVHYMPYNEGESLGQVSIKLETIQTRNNGAPVGSRWFVLERGEKRRQVRGRVHLRLCFEGGYHVTDESSSFASCTLPTDKLLWRPPLGTLELGILGARQLAPMKSTGSANGHCDAYCVAKHGNRWVRTRTVKEELEPQWNEQYMWDVYEPSTVLSVGVFDNRHLKGSSTALDRTKDAPMGKVRIRLSTLEGNRIYSGWFPLLMLKKEGLVRMGEVHLAIRFTYPSPWPIYKQYFKPLLPAMHYFWPISSEAAETLRIAALNLVAERLARSDPPLRREVVEEMLDTDESLWTMRRSKANLNRIKAVLAGVSGTAKAFDDVCLWKDPKVTLLAHLVYIALLHYPHFILPSAFLCLFASCLLNYQSRPIGPPQMDFRLSGGEEVDEIDDDEAEEENDPASNEARLSFMQNPYKNYKIIKGKLDTMKGYAARVQNALGQAATQGERLQALFSWDDPRATGIFCSVCLASAILLYIIPFRYIAMLAGCFVMRHPRFRDPLPPPPVNLFSRLPSLADRII